MALVQRLVWWHGEGKQTLKVTGLVEKPQFGGFRVEDTGYYEQCNQGASNCYRNVNVQLWLGEGRGRYAGLRALASATWG